MVKSEIAQLDLVFHALADATRRSILHGIAQNEKTVSQIALPYRMTLAAVSKHLKVLESANLIERRKEGSFQIVSLKADTLKSAEQWIAYYQQFWSNRLDALQELMEENKMSEAIKVQMSKIIRAPRSKVFAAWSDPKLLKIWFAPGALLVPDAHVDFKVRGAFVIAMEGEMQGRQTNGKISGNYKEIIPDERLVFTCTGTWRGDAPETIVTVEFIEVAEGTEITLVQEGFVDAKDFEGYKYGWESSFGKLGKVFEQ